ncbi:MAG TPA: hypothetical protein VHY83_03265 [Solirubrobacteraceae bacterium]|jgi:hypothetical protein|nr:hypothetical protein [Solirubrobacteraceae bacterium]
MPYTNADARQQLLDALGEATEDLGSAVAALGEAYEQLDEQTGDVLEAQLFRPVQHAYGRAQRTYAAFAERHDLNAAELALATPGAPSRGPRGFIDDGVDAARRADEELATLQDSLLPVEVGDPELRSGLEEIRTLLGHVPGRARELVRTLGR